MLLTFHLLLDRYNVFQYGFVVLAVLTLICYLTFVSSVFYCIMLYYCCCCCCCCSLYSIVSLLHAGMEKEKTKYPVPALQLVICLVYAEVCESIPIKCFMLHVYFGVVISWQCIARMSCFIAHVMFYCPQLLMGACKNRCQSEI